MARGPGATARAGRGRRPPRRAASPPPRRSRATPSRWRRGRRTSRSDGRPPGGVRGVMATKAKRAKALEAKREERRYNHVLKGSHGGMQLVLTEDVPHLGKQGDVVEVKPGYGRNYLLPRGMATVPTPHNLRQLERFKIRVKQAREARMADLRALAEQINKMPGITVEANANEEGHLYGSVGAAEISKGLKAKALPV